MSVFDVKIDFQLIYIANKIPQNYSIFWIAHIVLAISPNRIHIFQRVIFQKYLHTIFFINKLFFQ